MQLSLDPYIFGLMQYYTIKATNGGRAPSDSYEAAITSHVCGRLISPLEFSALLALLTNEPGHFRIANPVGDFVEYFSNRNDNSRTGRHAWRGRHGTIHLHSRR